MLTDNLEKDAKLKQLEAENGQLKHAIDFMWWVNSSLIEEVKDNQAELAVLRTRPSTENMFGELIAVPDEELLRGFSS